MSTAKTTAVRDSDYRIKGGLANAWKISFVLGVIGLAGAGYGYTLDPDHKRFAFSYLFAFFTFLTMALGALFFVLIQYITKAGWSVTVRRTSEFFMAGLPVFAILVIPLIFTMRPLFSQWLDLKPNQAFIDAAYPHGEHPDAARMLNAAPARENELGEVTAPASPEESTRELMAQLREERQKRLEKYEEEERTHILHEKAPYLNDTFFRIRTGFYIVVWILLAWKYFSWSTDQDRTKNVDNTAAAQKWAPVGLMLFALTLTFAAFDWLMSLDPFWYSTIFGVTIFAGCTVVNMALMVLTTMLLRKNGAMKDAVNVEHYHDMGKLLFGWLVFWAYVSFSQFFLIWYSNIPEELVYFHRRWDGNGGTWQPVTLAIVVLHFAFPFWLLMSRNIKRRVTLLGVGAATLIVMHIIEVYWIVMPNFGPFQPHWVDAACFIGVGGIYLGEVLRRMAQNPVIPVGDPRLVRALKFENA